jgi:hypothetical protein
MDKVTDFITIRVPPQSKIDYDKLDAVAKKKAKMAVLHALGKVCFAEIHYNPELYFGIDYKVEDE